MKVMIVNAFGRSNRGDSVLLDECIAEVKVTFPNAQIGCAVFEGMDTARAAHTDVRFSERIGNTQQKGAIAKLVTLARLILAALAVLPGLGWLTHALPSAQQDSWRMIREADIVISAPGGYIHDTNFAYYVALFHIWLGQQRGTRVVLAPQSIGPIDAVAARHIAHTVLSRSDAVCARESYSWEFLHRTLNLPEKVLRRSGDSAFWNTNISKDTASSQAAWSEIGIDPETGPILGLTVVDWSFPKSTDMVAARANYVQGLARVIDHMTTRHGFRAVIFNQVSEDLGMANRVASASTAPVLIDRVSREPDVLRALIARSTLFLGTRFHSCIFAMMAHRPTFAIAYLPKTSFILRDLDLEARQTPITEFDPEAVIAALERDLADLPVARAEIEAAVSRYRDTHARLSDVLEETA